VRPTGGVSGCARGGLVRAEELLGRRVGCVLSPTAVPNGFYCNALWMVGEALIKIKIILLTSEQALRTMRPARMQRGDARARLTVR